ncbi:hypothetical protein [Ideonella livida]|uniref:MipA/OmpV family protein n=1 Tax=Ideonella livida TaxID=2707176 RepID=A0A7C9PIP5_9BURK|nr:hypothetical protein [Ideonella livida]NDY92993.1 hypothetical protein [Ideonella livida]
MTLPPLPRRALAAALLALTGLTAQAVDLRPQTSAPADDRADRGFSYFLGLGRQTIDYQEKASLYGIRSKAKTSSPMLISGALYVVDEDLLFSIDSASTFYPSATTERWTTTAASLPSGSGPIPITDPLVQTNQFTLSQTHTQLLAHWRLSGPVFAVAGPAVNTQTFKRYSFQPGVDDAVTALPGQVVEETSGEVLLMAGLALESERVKGRDSHLGLRVLAGVPVWRRVTNTNSPQYEFSGTKGYDVALEGRYSRAVYRGLHLGLWGKASLSQRERETEGSAAELPESRTRAMSAGLELLWKL